MLSPDESPNMVENGQTSGSSSACSQGSGACMPAMKVTFPSITRPGVQAPAARMSWGEGRKPPTQRFRPSGLTFVFSENKLSGDFFFFLVQHEKMSRNSRFCFASFLASVQLKHIDIGM